jgi:hypothetical protein
MLLTRLTLGTWARMRVVRMSSQGSTLSLVACARRSSHPRTRFEACTPPFATRRPQRTTLCSTLTASCAWCGTPESSKEGAPHPQSCSFLPACAPSMCLIPLGPRWSRLAWGTCHSSRFQCRLTQVRTITLRGWPTDAAQIRAATQTAPHLCLPHAPYAGHAYIGTSSQVRAAVVTACVQLIYSNHTSQPLVAVSPAPATHYSRFPSRLKLLRNTVQPVMMPVL